MKMEEFKEILKKFAEKYGEDATPKEKESKEIDFMEAIKEKIKEKIESIKNIKETIKVDFVNVMKDGVKEIPSCGNKVLPYVNMIKAMKLSEAVTDEDLYGKNGLCAQLLPYQVKYEKLMNIDNIVIDMDNKRVNEKEILPQLEFILKEMCSIYNAFVFCMNSKYEKHLEEQKKKEDKQAEKKAQKTADKK